MPPVEIGRFRYLGLLLALNVTFLLVSDFTGARIVSIFGIGVSVTVWYFPLTYLIGDVLAEVYGYGVARRVAWLSIACSILGSAVTGAQLLIPPAAFFDADPAFHIVFSPSLTIAVAGLLAFFGGDMSCAYVLAKMKIWNRGRRLWLRFVVSTMAGEGVNTALFYGVALRGALPGSALFEAIALGWALKVLVEIGLLPLTYWTVRFLKQREDVDHYDDATDFNPFQLL